MDASIYEFLGLTIGINLHGMTPQEKQNAYAADITFGTNNEFGLIICATTWYLVSRKNAARTQLCDRR